MYIYETVNFDTFAKAFKQIRPDNFSYDGLRVLFDIVEDYAQAVGEPQELDVIALCCDYTEATLEEVNADYMLVDSEDYDDEEDYHNAIMEALEERTTAYHVDADAVIYQVF